MANRLLLLASFLEEPLPKFRSQAKDIVELRESLERLLQGESEFHISEGGTTFRFLLVRLSRTPGKFKIFAAPRLLERPHQVLYEGLEKLGVTVQVEKDHVLVEGQGWLPPSQSLAIDCTLSTQYASAFLLSSKNLDFTFELETLNLQRSLPYWQMTTSLFEAETLPVCELDMSSAFSVAAVAAVNQGVIIKNFPEKSLQADFVFVDTLERMGVEIEKSEDLKITPQRSLKSIEVDLEKCPDLLPVLSALCAFAAGESVLKNIGHVRFKESDRLAKSIELIEKAGARAFHQEENLHIIGNSQLTPGEEFTFDPDQDHRMAMAAAVFMAAGWKIDLQEPQVVEKSFPDFWQVVEVDV